MHNRISIWCKYPYENKKKSFEIYKIEYKQWIKKEAAMFFSEGGYVELCLDGNPLDIENQGEISSFENMKIEVADCSRAIWHCNAFDLCFASELNKIKMRRLVSQKKESSM